MKIWKYEDWRKGIRNLASQVLGAVNACDPSISFLPLTLGPIFTHTFTNIYVYVMCTIYRMIGGIDFL